MNHLWKLWCIGKEHILRGVRARYPASLSRQQPTINFNFMKKPSKRQTSERLKRSAATGSRTKKIQKNKSFLQNDSAWKLPIISSGRRHYSNRRELPSRKLSNTAFKHGILKPIIPACREFTDNCVRIGKYTNNKNLVHKRRCALAPTDFPKHKYGLMNITTKLPAVPSHQGLPYISLWKREKSSYAPIRKKKKNNSNHRIKKSLTEAIDIAQKNMLAAQIKKNSDANHGESKCASPIQNVAKCTDPVEKTSTFCSNILEKELQSTRANKKLVDAAVWMNYRKTLTSDNIITESRSQATYALDEAERKMQKYSKIKDLKNSPYVQQTLELEDEDYNIRNYTEQLDKIQKQMKLGTRTKKTQCRTNYLTFKEDAKNYWETLGLEEVESNIAENSKCVSNQLLKKIQQLNTLKSENATTLEIESTTQQFENETEKNIVSTTNNSTERIDLVQALLHKSKNIKKTKVVDIKTFEEEVASNWGQSDLSGQNYNLADSSDNPTHVLNELQKKLQQFNTSKAINNLNNNLEVVEETLKLIEKGEDNGSKMANDNGEHINVDHNKLQLQKSAYLIKKKEEEAAIFLAELNERNRTAAERSESASSVLDQLQSKLHALRLSKEAALSNDLALIQKNIESNTLDAGHENKVAYKYTEEIDASQKKFYLAKNNREIKRDLPALKEAFGIPPFTGVRPATSEKNVFDGNKSYNKWNKLFLRDEEKINMRKHSLNNENTSKSQSDQQVIETENLENDPDPMDYEQGLMPTKVGNNKILSLPTTQPTSSLDMLSVITKQVYEQTKAAKRLQEAEKLEDSQEPNEQENHSKLLVKLQNHRLPNILETTSNETWNTGKIDYNAENNVQQSDCKSQNFVDNHEPLKKQILPVATGSVNNIQMNTQKQRNTRQADVEDVSNRQKETQMKLLPMLADRKETPQNRYESENHRKIYIKTRSSTYHPNKEVNTVLKNTAQTKLHAEGTNMKEITSPKNIEETKFDKIINDMKKIPQDRHFHPKNESIQQSSERKSEKPPSAYQTSIHTISGNEVTVSKDKTEKKLIPNLTSSKNTSQSKNITTNKPTLVSYNINEFTASKSIGVTKHTSQTKFDSEDTTITPKRRSRTTVKKANTSGSIPADSNHISENKLITGRTNMKRDVDSKLKARKKFTSSESGLKESKQDRDETSEYENTQKYFRQKPKKASSSNQIPNNFTSVKDVTVSKNLREKKLIPNLTSSKNTSQSNSIPVNKSTPLRDNINEVTVTKNIAGTKYTSKIKLGSGDTTTTPRHRSRTTVTRANTRDTASTDLRNVSENELITGKTNIKGDVDSKLNTRKKFTSSESGLKETPQNRDENPEYETTQKHFRKKPKKASSSNQISRSSTSVKDVTVSKNLAEKKLITNLTASKTTPHSKTIPANKPTEMRYDISKVNISKNIAGTKNTSQINLDSEDTMTTPRGRSRTTVKKANTIGTTSADSNHSSENKLNTGRTNTKRGVDSKLKARKKFTPFESGLKESKQDRDESSEYDTTQKHFRKKPKKASSSNQIPNNSTSVKDVTVSKNLREKKLIPNLTSSKNTSQSKSIPANKSSPLRDNINEDTASRNIAGIKHTSQMKLDSEDTTITPKRRSRTTVKKAHTSGSISADSNHISENKLITGKTNMKGDVDSKHKARKKFTSSESGLKETPQNRDESPEYEVTQEHFRKKSKKASSSNQIPGNATSVKDVTVSKNLTEKKLMSNLTTCKNTTQFKTIPAHKSTPKKCYISKVTASTNIAGVKSISQINRDSEDTTITPRHRSRTTVKKANTSGSIPADTNRISENKLITNRTNIKRGVDSKYKSGKKFTPSESGLKESKQDRDESIDYETTQKHFGKKPKEMSNLNQIPGNATIVKNVTVSKNLTEKKSDPNLITCKTTSQSKIIPENKTTPVRYNINDITASKSRTDMKETSQRKLDSEKTMESEGSGLKEDPLGMDDSQKAETIQENLKQETEIATSPYGTPNNATSVKDVTVSEDVTEKKLIPNSTSSKNTSQSKSISTNEPTPTRYNINKVTASENMASMKETSQIKHDPEKATTTQERFPAKMSKISKSSIAEKKISPIVKESLRGKRERQQHVPTHSHVMEKPPSASEICQRNIEVNTVSESIPEEKWATVRTDMKDKIVLKNVREKEITAMDGIKEISQENNQAISTTKSHTKPINNPLNNEIKTTLENMSKEELATVSTDMKEILNDTSEYTEDVDTIEPSVKTTLDSLLSSISSQHGHTYRRRIETRKIDIAGQLMTVKMNNRKSTESQKAPLTPSTPAPASTFPTAATAADNCTRSADNKIEAHKPSVTEKINNKKSLINERMSQNEKYEQISATNLTVNEATDMASVKNKIQQVKCKSQMIIDSNERFKEDCKASSVGNGQTKTQKYEYTRQENIVTASKHTIKNKLTSAPTDIKDPLQSKRDTEKDVASEKLPAKEMASVSNKDQTDSQYQINIPASKNPTAVETETASEVTPNNTKSAVDLGIKEPPQSKHESQNSTYTQQEKKDSSMKLTTNMSSAKITYSREGPIAQLRNKNAPLKLAPASITEETIISNDISETPKDHLEPETSTDMKDNMNAPSNSNSKPCVNRTGLKSNKVNYAEGLMEVKVGNRKIVKPQTSPPPPPAPEDSDKTPTVRLKHRCRACE
ncbi:uncharacterized protein LOC119688032 [Teleopsis dalmanni]|uniref:uncharacterized protein LOC119688032 n=1 Tax=Teleopsis dalmanni TaxID=139649 RepID=UPI0018CEF3E9|nr:uncharacterized protein LOC119688032 [Teleopsis dalmanni]